MTFRFGLRSKANLLGVHPDLVKVAHLALSMSPVDFTVTEGLRTPSRQKELFAQHKSQTLRSRHITGHAIDVAALRDGKVTWNWQEYADIAVAFKAAAKELGISITWGGDWKSFKDGPHFELSYSAYPVVLDATAGEQA
jgi:peptidoglycan L-alanyl-D-glutamate endopeptidase CwlK